MSQLTPAQVEQIKEIGDKLRQTRQEQSMLLEEVKVRTYIPLRVLQALETGQVDQLPEPVFVQGFIRRYADVLGLDGLALAQSLPLDLGSIPPALVPLESSPGQAFSLPSLRPYLPVGLVVIASLAVIILAPQIGKFLATKRSTPPSPVAASSTPAPPLASPTPSPKAIVPSSIEVAVKLTDDSWVQITIDDKPEFEGVLPKGSTRSWKAREKLTVQAGNAGAVTVSFNQGQSRVMGELGEVQEVTFTPQGIQTQP